MDRLQAKSSSPKIFLMWFPIFIILLIKSTVVLVSLFSLNKAVILFGIYAVIPLFFLISFSFLFSSRGQLFYLIGLDLFISLLFIADMVYGRAFGHQLSVYMIFAKNVMKDLSSSVISLVKWSDFLMLIDIPFLFFLAIKMKDSVKIRKRAIMFVFTSIVSLFLMGAKFVELEDSKRLGNYRLHPLLMSPVGNHIFDLYRFIYEKSYTLDKKDIGEIEAWLEENKRFQEPAEEYTDLKGIIKGKNIIAIQFESLENLMIGQAHYEQEITPNINKLLNSSIYFNNIYEQVKDGNSSDAELLYLASVYPISKGSAFLRFGKNNYFTLPKLLKKEGYTSVAIHGDDKEFWNRDEVFPSMGFERYISEEEFNDKTMEGMGIADESLFRQSISEIESLKEPFNFFIITMTSHMPFEMDKERKYLDLPMDDATSNYLQSIHYTDKVFGEFYNSLQESGILEDSILIIYGDHQGIHKYYETTLPDNNNKVPFIINIPGMQGFQVDKAGGQIDMMPTLAYLLGIDSEEYATKVMGRNLFGRSSGAAILPTGQIMGGSNEDEHLKSAQRIADFIISGNYFQHKLDK